MNNISHQTFGNGQTIQPGSYENCIFSGCDLEGNDLSGYVFSDCVFKQCSLGNCRTDLTDFRNVRFEGCRLTGMRFDTCTALLFPPEFISCNLSLASFSGMKLRGIVFSGCVMRETDLSEADLSHARFEDCDLERAVFDQTRLDGADLSSAYRYSIDPERNRLKKTVFSFPAAAGLLDKYDIVWR